MTLFDDQSSAWEAKLWRSTIFLVGILGTIYGLMSSLPQPHVLYDFASFYSSGVAWRRGVPPYDLLLQKPIIETCVLNGCFPNLNPPSWFPIFALYSLLPPQASFFTNYLITLFIAFTILLMSLSRTKERSRLALLCGSSSL